MKDIIQLAAIYWRHAGKYGLAHYRAAQDCEWKGRLIGLPVTVFSTIVATSVFVTASESVDTNWRLATGSIAVLAAILVALQTFLNYGDRAAKHKAVGAKYLSVRRELDMFKLHLEQLERQKAMDSLEAVTKELNSLATDSPTLTENIVSRAENEFQRDHPEPYIQPVESD